MVRIAGRLRLRPWSRRPLSRCSCMGTGVRPPVALRTPSPGCRGRGVCPTVAGAPSTRGASWGLSASCGRTRGRVDRMPDADASTAAVYT